MLEIVLFVRMRLFSFKTRGGRKNLSSVQEERKSEINEVLCRDNSLTVSHSVHRVELGNRDETLPPELTTQQCSGWWSQ